MEGRASKAMKWAVFWLLMVCGALAGIYCYSAAVTPASDNYCAMTYMRPSYFEVLTESEWSSKYRVGRTASFPSVLLSATPTTWSAHASYLQSLA